ncbi:SPFH/Band 7/PHB domain-containing membrane-associated protein family [Rhynchospora pubera]|uniref:SPFH/Band 7/PHB domain-containing membrane-associated protein family n=1 Tax=Rhynchospora pubera TaxID=906938 RepID=A0AAV8DH67_9POAL|nr:SPFH/Band 7/PHB domain-containing membrane-associated protein family [Rhynchospora pubera]
MGQAFGCVKVPESTVAIRESWGKFDNVLDPGCHFVPWCSGKSIAGFVNLRLQQLVVSCETNTKDNVSVTVVAAIQYRALDNKPYAAFYQLSNPKEQIKSYAYDAICARIQKLILDDVFEKTNEIVKDVKEEFKETMSMYGYEIVQILIVNIELDEHFERAMNESIAEKWKAESKHQNELAIARQRRAIADDLRDSIEAFSKNLPGISSSDFMEMVLATRYLDDTKEIAAQSKSVSISLGAGALKMVVKNE